jgi:dCMP deaminase
VFLLIATDLAALSTCDRAAVGAVIVRDGRCISWGFNGAPPGMPHCDENHHGWDHGPADNIVNPEDAVEQFGCRNATHAEANALAAAAKQGISTDAATLYVTVSPCETCSRLLIAAGIVRVVFAKRYRDESGLHLLRDAGVFLKEPSE